MPRFAYEGHLRALVEERRWPSSTVDISELRLVIDYQRRNGAERTLTLDIVDYPGEWLLDLPLLGKSYRAMVAREPGAVAGGSRAPLWPRSGMRIWRRCRPTAPENEQATLAAAKLFTDYLRACRDERFAMSLLPPGRFLMPGNLAGSPALTFAPLDVPADGAAPGGLAMGDDGAALRGLQRHRGAAVLSRSFRPARSPDRAGRCARRLQRRT